MTNVHYLRGQLTMALECIRRGLDALEAEPAAAALPPQPVLDSLGLVEVSAQERLWVALTERVDNLTRIVLDISPDVCAKHDLFPF